MPDLGSQLRDHYDSVVTLFDPQDVIEGRLTPVEKRPVPRVRVTRFGWAAGFVAAVVVLVTVGGLLLLLRPTADSSSVATTPPPTTAIASTTSTIPTTTSTIPSATTVPVVGWDGLPDLAVGAVPPPFTGTLLDVTTGDPPSMVEGGSWSLHDQRGRPVLVHYTHREPRTVYAPWEDNGLAVLAEERAADMAFVVVLRKYPDPWIMEAFRASGYAGPIIADPLQPDRGSDPHLWGLSPHAGLGTEQWVLLDGDGRVMGRFCGCDARDVTTAAKLLEQLIAALD